MIESQHAGLCRQHDGATDTSNQQLLCEVAREQRFSGTLQSSRESGGWWWDVCHVSFFRKGGMSAISISAAASVSLTQVPANHSGRRDTAPVEPCTASTPQAPFFLRPMESPWYCVPLDCRTETCTVVLCCVRISMHVLHTQYQASDRLPAAFMKRDVCLRHTLMTFALPGYSTATKYRVQTACPLSFALICPLNLGREFAIAYHDSIFPACHARPTELWGDHRQTFPFKFLALELSAKWKNAHLAHELIRTRMSHLSTRP